MDSDTALVVGLLLLAASGGWLFIRAFRKLRWFDKS